MIGPNVCFLHQNHEYKDINIPMCFQGYKKVQPIIIEDDCWIGQNVLVTAGRKIRYGSIVAAGSVVTRDFEPYSIIGGNPARCIKSRN